MLNSSGECYSLYGDASLLVLRACANVIAMTYLDRSRRVQCLLSIHLSMVFSKSVWQRGDAREVRDRLRLPPLRVINNLPADSSV